MNCRALTIHCSRATVPRSRAAVPRFRAAVPRFRAAVPGPWWASLITLTVILVAGCTGHPDASATDEITFHVPPGASFAQVTDTLHARGLVGAPKLFRAFARIRGYDRSVRAGQYQVPAAIRWAPLLDRLVEGRVVTVVLTIPEGFTLRQMAPRIGAVTERDPEEVEDLLLALGEQNGVWDVPGPGLEGYLFPDTYHLAPGVSIETVIRTMVERYHRLWTDERRARAEELGMSEREVMTLASIVQGEARGDSEMPVISGVFHNRMRIGYPLQADPTVQYALGERRSRLLYADIDSVANHPYNTYTHMGLPPGPIGAAGEAALDAALNPADVDYLYFVARPDGTHIFTRTLEEHNRARVEARQLQREAESRRNEGTTP
jgi:UPF0755 protein